MTTLWFTPDNLYIIIVTPNLKVNIKTKMRKRLFHSSFVLMLIFGLNLMVYPCTPPAAPTNVTDSLKLSICEGQNTQLTANGVGNLGWYSASSGGTYLGNGRIFITGKLTETTTFYVQDSTCEASTNRMAITVIVNPKPIANFSMSDSCGETGTFVNHSKNGKSYLWHLCGKLDTSKSPKHFFGDHLHKFWGHFAMLIVYSYKGCSDTMFKYLNLNSDPYTDFTFTANQLEVNFKPKQAGSTKYKWLFGDGDSTQTPNATHTYTKSGTYTVCLQVTNAAKCSAETCKEVLLTAANLKPIEPRELRIYPNPNSGNFIIEKNGAKEFLTIDLLNQIGQSIHKEELKENLNLMNLNLANGIYLIKLTDGVNVINQRIVVSR